MTESIEYIRGFENWIHDDITWCICDNCENADCFRNQKNRRNRIGWFSAADFRGTKECPLTDTEVE